MEGGVSLLYGDQEIERYRKEVIIKIWFFLIRLYLLKVDDFLIEYYVLIGRGLNF